ncbi:MAG: TatD family hydrolase [Thermoproteus sp. AZ2]|uniref:TatD family hydrolase n=1 Tax=Thermoproteus sp. AZ2 TaxID=1609232 RepID=A0ACC6V199_9CREN|nr:MAG: deoxyribonuclease [Thermoproteus sp. AZ2]
MRVFDNHCHANELTGLGAEEVVKRFKRAGGVGVVFVSLLTWSIGGTPGDRGSVAKLYEHTVRNAQVARSHSLISGAVVGVHPAECIRLLEAGWRPAEVLEFMRWTVDLAAEYVKEGKAVGLGEYGRPHWPVDPAWRSLCDEVIKYAISRARDVGAVVHLHLERNGLATVESIAELAKAAGAKELQVVMHHIEPSAAVAARERGLAPSIPIGRRGELEQALALPPIYLVESDYIDDNKRPGAVIPPWTLAAKLRRAVEAGVIGESYVEELFKNAEAVYATLFH